MSVTFSEVAAAALVEAASQPGLAGRRLALRDAFSLSPAAVYAAIEARLDADAVIETGSGTHTMRAVTLSGGRLLLPYLVSDIARAGSNVGSAGFAATLRTQFRAGASEDRVLLILDPRPVETVLSASEDAAGLPQLAWEELAQRALRMAALDVGTRHSSFAERGVREFTRHQEPSSGALEQLAGWLADALQGSESAAGRELWKLGCFLSDPEAHTDSGRFVESAKLRRQLDERYASQSKPWDAEVRRLLKRTQVPADVIDRVVAAAGPFGIRYERFTLSDLRQREDAPPPLRTDEFEPVLDARAAIREGDALIVWLPTGAAELRLRLRRQARTADEGIARWTSSEPGVLELVAGQSTAALPLPGAAGSGWLFGVLELHPGSAARTADPSEVLQVAVYRSDAGWFPAEDALQVDAAGAGFACEDEPVVIAYGESGEPLGRASYGALPEATEDMEWIELAVEFRGERAALPVLLRGEAPVEEPLHPGPAEDLPDEVFDGPGISEPQPPATEHPSVAHALLDAGRSEWPDARLSNADGRSQVSFRIGARQLRVSPQRPAGTDGAVLEQAILEHPEWTTYVWSAQSRTLSRARGASISAGALPEAAVQRFSEARGRLFAAASRRGSIYAVDPAGAEVSEYVAAYDALIAAVPADARYQADWDGLLLCDAVFMAGQPDLLFAPTSPLAVAFHAASAAKFRTWIDARDKPPAEDIRAIALRHALPLLHARDQWYETAPAPELLWRRYLPLATEAPGVPERNARFIAQRLHFFLHVHETYKDPGQVLSVAFHQPGDGRIVLDALRSFYSRERSASEYSLPRLHAYLVGSSAHLGTELAQLLAGGRQDDLDLLVQSRVTITATPASEPPEFAHLTFLFRSPGVRSPRQVPMDDRPPTDYLSGLAAAPGRRVYSERNKVFAWGTWARGGERGYHWLLRRSLELVAGQPTGRIAPGWTQMASTSVDQEALDELYRERSVWVVHLDRLIGIEAFGGPRQLIEYEERADPDEPGYDGITATEQIEPYLDAVGRALSHLGDPSEQPLRRLLQLLNAVSGRWALELLQRGDNDILQRIGFVATIAAIEQLESCLGTSRDGTGVLVALDELIAGRPHAGLPRFSLPVPLPDGQMCDDLLVLWVPRDAPADEPVVVRGVVIEVKFASRGRPATDEARGEIARTRNWLHSAFNTEGAARPFRARDLAELINAAAARAATFELGRPAQPEALDAALTRIARGEYQLDLTHWRAGRPRTGIVASVEGESTVATSQAELTDSGDPLDLLRIGRPVLRQLVAGARLRPAGLWEQISFNPPTASAPARPATPPLPADPQQRQRPATEPGDSAGEAESVERPRIETGRVEREAAKLPALARALDEAMEKYRLATEPFQPELAQVGPNVIRFRTRPLGPLSVADVERRARDIGREIGAPAGVIVSQEPRYICIDVPRAEREPVLYRDLAPIAAAQASEPGALSFVAGVAPSGHVRVADLARLPHLLVAGATGSGKSVFLRAMLCHLVRVRGPATLRILLVDPKQLDFAGFAPLPHLLNGRIISEPAEAVEVLQHTIESELEHRRPILIGAGATSATEFYERGGTYEELPQMVVLVDEFADLAAVMDRRERQSFQELIQRYAQLTRAFGIYLVLATQRPSVDVITGSIKANLTARIALSLPSHRDSMTVLDRAGAEDLLGNGDLLFYVNGQVARLQAPFADANDVAAAVERWRQKPDRGGGG